MSQDQLSRDHDDIPRFEPWLGVMAGSLVPAAVALFLPHDFALVLITCTALLFVAGLVMLGTQSRRRARERTGGRVEPASRPPDSASERESVAAEAE